jgi:folate-binding protein YgfZ
MGADPNEAFAQYAAVRQSLGLVDRSDAGAIEVTGRDRATFLHAMLTNDVTALAPGQGCAAALLDVHGKVQTFLWLWVLDDRILVVTPPGLAGATVETLERYLFAEKAYLREISGDLAMFLLAGPGVRDGLARLAGLDAPERAWCHLPARIGEIDVRVVRGGGESGEAEAWLVCGAGDGAAVRDAAVAAGARPVGHEAWEAARIEAGTPVFGADVEASVLLPEVPFLDRVSYTKGCYLGQEVVVRIRDRGRVNRTLLGLALEGDAVPEKGARIAADGADAGHVTSATWSWALKQPIALGFVRRQYAEPGTRVTVAVGGTTASAIVSALPFAR